ncbi:MAG: glycosyltransferase family 2 protein [Acidobacteria bacterium]|nr:glycosyltransferase family 2 protein [Acidobacteriota bacterium]
MGDIVAVIPAYNASLTISAVVRKARAHLSRVYVVDDGSTDDTADRARRAGAQVLTHSRNRGKGAALRTAFAELARTGVDAVVTLDADGQHDPDDIPRLVESFRASGADLIIGSRWQAFSEMSRPRRFGNRFSSSALAFFTGLHVPDSQSGFRLYSTPFLQSARLKGEAYELEMEAILVASSSGRKVQTIPISLLVPDGRALSHFRPVRDTYRICACVVGFSLRRLLGKAP